MENSRLAAYATIPRLLKITFPCDFAPQAADAGLGLDLQEQLQSSFYGSLLRMRPVVPPGLEQQTAVNIDSCSHARVSRSKDTLLL